MNTNPNTKRILCYGDSNTWGVIPGTQKRHPADTRWTGILQKKLGDEYEILEEGLNGRTTAIDDDQKKGRNGLTYLRPCLETNNPFQLIILMLGTNDMKERYNQSPTDIANNLRKLLDEIFEFEKERSESDFHILVISPPEINELVPGVSEKYKFAGKKSKQLSMLYADIAKEYKFSFLDASKIVSPSEIDGYHLDEISHQKLAQSIFKQIQDLI